MAQCPNCSKSIAVTEDHFGTLYRCEHCGTEFFIGFDGAPENSKEPIASDPVVEEPAVTPLSDMSADPQESTNQQPTSDLFNIQTPSYEQSFYQSPEPGGETGSDVFKSFTEDVQNFGNEISETGILTFDIEISGIDLGEIKRDLIEALDDKRFGWNLEEITESIKDGKLTLSNVSAPKIIVLVKRITPIGLSLNWRHHVSTQ